MKLKCPHHQVNRPFPSYPVPLFQNESSCEAILMKMCSANTCTLMQIKFIFIRLCWLRSDYSKLGARDFLQYLKPLPCTTCVLVNLWIFLQETEEELIIPPPPKSSPFDDDDDDVERRLQSLLDVAEEDKPDVEVNVKDFSGLKELDKIGYVVRFRAIQLTLKQN